MTQIRTAVGIGSAFQRMIDEGEVAVIEREVDSIHEVAGVFMKLDGLRYTPGVLFRNVKGFSMPVGGTLFSERARVRRLLGMPDDPLEFKHAFMAALEKRVEPVLVPDGPCQEVVLTEGFDALSLVPSIQASLDDGGRYFQAAVLTRDPETGRRNMGMYRNMLLSDNRTVINIRPEAHIGMHLRKAKRRGEPFPVALLFGVDAEVYLAGVTKLPFGEEELALAGTFKGEPVELVKCRTIDLEVPASANIVLEGVVEPPYDEEWEGPWPEYLKYLSIPQRKPIFRITAVTHCAQPMTYNIVPGTKENYNIRISNDVAFYKYVKAIEPTFVVDAVLTRGSAHWHHGVIQLRKDTPDREGHHIQVALAAFGFSVYLETLTLVDEDVDIYDMDAIDWAVTTRCNPKEQVHILPEARTHRNNPIAGVRSLIPGDSVVKAKMIVDATIPWKYKTIQKEGVPPLFMRARFQETPLEDYLTSEDFRRWVG
ncbi:MAG: UbiD family decarboxylase [Nitrospinota bacterium]